MAWVLGGPPECNVRRMKANWRNSLCCEPLQCECVLWVPTSQDVRALSSLLWFQTLLFQGLLITTTAQSKYSRPALQGRNLRPREGK